MPSTSFSLIQLHFTLCKTLIDSCLSSKSLGLFCTGNRYTAHIYLSHNWDSPSRYFLSCFIIIAVHIFDIKISFARLVFLIETVFQEPQWKNHSMESMLDQNSLLLHPRESQTSTISIGINTSDRISNPLLLFISVI